MQGKGLLIAVAVLAVLSGALWWTNKNPEDPLAKADAKSEAMITLSRGDLVEVTVTRKGEKPLVLRKNASGNWEMASEPALVASANDVMEVVINATSVMSDQVVDENSTDMIQYGLDPPQITLKVKDKAGKTEELWIGDQAPVGMKFYARRPNAKKVVAIGQNYKVGIDKTPNDLRDKRMLIFEDAKLTGFELARKDATLEFTRNGKGTWQMSRPQAYRVEATAIDDLLTKLGEAKFDPLASADTLKQQATAFASATPVAVVKITDASGTRQLEVRKTKENQVLAKSAAVEGVHKLGEDLAKLLDKGLDDFRSKKLMDFGFDDPAKVVFENSGKTSTLEHKGEDWIWNGKKADSATVHEFLEGLRGFTAMSFVEKKFTTPTITIRVTSKDGKQTETLKIARVGNFQYAQRDGEPGEFELDPKSLGDLEAAMAKIKEAGAAKK